jgi:hypothetical protein
MDAPFGNPVNKIEAGMSLNEQRREWVRIKNFEGGWGYKNWKNKN